mgnify:CR=1 FL=1
MSIYHSGEFIPFNMECMIDHICDDDIDIVAKGTSILYELEEIWDEELECEPTRPNMNSSRGMRKHLSSPILHLTVTGAPERSLVDA